MNPRLVILESPYAGDITANVTYARECLRDSLRARADGRPVELRYLGASHPRTVG